MKPVKYDIFVDIFKHMLLDMNVWNSYGTLSLDEHFGIFREIIISYFYIKSLA